MSGLSQWQRTETRATVVLEEVFCWLDGNDLARAGATCRLWRQVAATPALWRRLVLRDEVDARSIGPRQCRWREHYVCAHASWNRTEQLRVGALAVHGALSPAGDRLALAAADSSVSVWKPEENTWVELWRCDLRESRGWASAARVMWAASGCRLLAAGPLVLAEPGSPWELLVLQFDERGTGRITSRARCGAGAAGCWVNATGDAFLSLELLLLAPGLAITSVWMNAATQEIQSEYTGVASRLFCIYNEGAAHLSQVVVVEKMSDIEVEPRNPSLSEPILVAAWGEKLGSWLLGRSRPQPVEVRDGGSLLDRVRVMRERALLPDPEPADFDEETIRKQCAIPHATYAFQNAPIGIVLLDCPGEPYLWISTSDGTVMGFSTPNLVPLRKFISSVTTTPLTLHYVQPAVSEHHVANPQGSLSGTVCVWALRGAGPHQMRLLNHRSAATVALLLRDFPPVLLVFAGDELHVWRSHATPQPDTNFAAFLDLTSSANVLKKGQPLVTYLVHRATGSCAGPRPNPPCECIVSPAQNCRTVVSNPASVVHVLCKPPPPAPPPPCPSCGPAEPLTCTNYVTREEVHTKRPSPLPPISSDLDRLENRLDRVACRLAHAERTRQFNYEQEAALDPPPRPRSAPLVRYQLGDVAHLASDDGCFIRRVIHTDPCAHRPRLQLKIQRNGAEPSSTLHSSPQLRSENSSPRGRCERTLKSAVGTPRCRPPSVVERLRGLSRSAGSGHPGDRHGLHTTADTGVTMRADGLTKALQSREQLREAGRGRIACTADVTGSARTYVAGILELSVPEGVRRLRVHVTLEDLGEAQANDSAREDFSTPDKTPDAWLSIKNIHNKFTGNKKETCGLAAQIKNPGSSPCTERVPGMSGAMGVAGAGGAGRCGKTALLSAAPVPSN